MSAPQKRGCATCRFADWSYNPAPRARGPGDCRWEPPPPVPLPISITQRSGYSNALHRTRIWKDMGEDCPTWEPVE